jgi:hypothetical protein
MEGIRFGVPIRPRRRAILFGLLFLVLGTAVVWGPTLRESAELTAIRAAIAGHDWQRAEALLTGGGSRGFFSGRPPEADRQYLLGRLYRRQRRFSEAERCFDAAAGLGFDAAAWEVWPTLCAGGTLCLPDAAVRLDPAKPAFHNKLAESLLASGRADEARTAATEAQPGRRLPGEQKSASRNCPVQGYFGSMPAKRLWVTRPGWRLAGTAVRRVGQKRQRYSDCRALSQLGCRRILRPSGSGS